MTSRSSISIWFFLGSMLLMYGVVVTASALVNRDASGQLVVLAQLHPDLLWGLLLLGLGAFSCARYYPKKAE